MTPRTPGPQPDSFLKKSHACGHQGLHLRGCGSTRAFSCTLDEGYTWTRMVFLFSPPNEDFSQNSSCCQEKGGRFYLSPQFVLGLLEFQFFSNFPLAVGVSLSLPSSKALLPQAAGQEINILSISLGFFFFFNLQQIGFLMGKGSLVRKCQICCLNKVLCCDEAAPVAPRADENWKRHEYRLRWP